MERKKKSYSGSAHGKAYQKIDLNAIKSVLELEKKGKRYLSERIAKNSLWRFRHRKEFFSLSLVLIDIARSFD